MIPSNRKVMIAVPCYDGRVCAQTTRALIHNICALRSAGYTVYYTDALGDPYICNARNHLVDTFMRSDATDLIFIDSDLSFPDDTLVKLMKHDVQVVGGAYPFKTMKPGYPVTVMVDGPGCRCMFDTETKLVYAQMVPTGCLRINRSVFLTLQEKYPSLLSKVAEPQTVLWRYFRTGCIYPDMPGIWWGEDTAFCKDVREAGIQIWLEPDINFVHHGAYGYDGNYHQFQLSLPDTQTEVTNGMADLCKYLEEKNGSDRS